MMMIGFREIQVQELWGWLMINPARLIVLASAVVTWGVCVAEYGGRRSGGSGWLTMARIGSGAIFTLITACVAGFFGGIGAFFGYLLLQLVISVILPILIVEKM